MGGKAERESDGGEDMEDYELVKLSAPASSQPQKGNLDNLAMQEHGVLGHTGDSHPLRKNLLRYLLIFGMLLLTAVDTRALP